MSRNPLHSLALSGDAGAIRDRLSEHADANARDERGWTALMLAAMSGHFEVVRALVEAGADVNARALDGSSALLEAAVWGHDEIAAFLTDRGGDPDAADARGWTARQVIDQRSPHINKETV